MSHRACQSAGVDGGAAGMRIVRRIVAGPRPDPAAMRQGLRARRPARGRCWRADPIEQFAPVVRRRGRRPACPSPTRWSSRPPPRRRAVARGRCCSRATTQRGFVFFTNYALAQGPRPGGEPARRAGLPLAPARPPGAVVTGAARPVAGDETGGLLRAPPAGVPARRLGEPRSRAVHRRTAPSSTTRFAELAQRLAGGYAGAGPAVLGRLRRGAGDGGVLAGPAEPPARPAALPPYRRRLGVERLAP